MADNPKSPSSQWSQQAMGDAYQADNKKISQESLDDIAVILLQGDNMFGDRVYSYVKFTLKDFKNMRDAMEKGENFTPSDYGQIIAAGKGDPPQSLRDEMKVTYGLVDTPRPKEQTPEPEGVPKVDFFDEDDGF